MNTFMDLQWINLPQKQLKSLNLQSQQYSVNHLPAISMHISSVVSSIQLLSVNFTHTSRELGFSFTDDMLLYQKSELQKHWQNKKHTSRFQPANSADDFWSLWKTTLWISGSQQHYATFICFLEVSRLLLNANVLKLLYLIFIEFPDWSYWL